MKYDFKVNDGVEVLNPNKALNGYNGKIISIDNRRHSAEVLIWALDKTITFDLSDLKPDGTAYISINDTINNTEYTFDSVETFDGDEQLSNTRLKFRNFVCQENLIHNKKLLDLVYSYFANVVPDYFYIVPASSSGKYHPKYSNMPSGLVYHTIQTIKIAKNLLNSSLVKSVFNISEAYPNISKDDLNDTVVVALLVHDTFKLGHIKGEHTVYSHPNIAAAEFYNHSKTYINENKSKFPDNGGYMTTVVKRICAAVEQHMGEYGMTDCNDCISKFVSLCDYLSAQKLFEQMYKYDDLSIDENYFFQ